MAVGGGIQAEITNTVSSCYCQCCKSVPHQPAERNVLMSIFVSLDELLCQKRGDGWNKEMESGGIRKSKKILCVSGTVSLSLFLTTHYLEFVVELTKKEIQRENIVIICGSKLIIFFVF